MHSSFLTGLHQFSARKNKRRSLESLESGEKPNNPLVARYTDTLTTCSHCTVGTKKKWTHWPNNFMWVPMTINVCNKASQIKTTALFNIHYFRSILLLAFSVWWASPLLSGVLGFINTSPENTSHYWTTNCQRTGRSCSDIDLMHPPTHTYTYARTHVHTHKKRIQWKSKDCCFTRTQLFLVGFPPPRKSNMLIFSQHLFEV